MMNTKGHSNRIFSLRYHTIEPNFILTGSWDRMVQFWDVRERHAVRSILGPYVCGDSIDVSQDGEIILTGSQRTEKQLQLWDFKGGRLLQTIPWDSKEQCSVLAAQFSKHDASKTIVAAG